MLALITYKCIYHFIGVDYIISYKRRLLFYYCWMGFSRCLKTDNRQRLRFYYARS